MGSPSSTGLIKNGCFNKSCEANAEKPRPYNEVVKLVSYSPSSISGSMVAASLSHDEHRDFCIFMYYPEGDASEDRCP